MATFNQTESELLGAEVPSRYVVGIDLGTTNSAVAYADTSQAQWKVAKFPLAQFTAPAQVEELDTLPSFHYEGAAGEFDPAATRLPWNQRAEKYLIGQLARDQGQVTQGRLIASAKSWLCHSGIDRTAKVLPWRGAADLERLSPPEVCGRILRHIREAWNHAHPHEKLERQDIVLTLPASFDEVARELTVAAAAEAGLKRVVLIEEPQAAFYAWLDAHRSDWQQHVTAGQTILVCDIGGGTSDFTLIRVREGDDGRVHFQRVAVGDHLILGGDNLDLALAKHLEPRLAGGSELAPRDWAALVRKCRAVKEELLAADPPPRLSLHLPRSGAKLIGGGLQTEVTREEAARLLLEGFLPQVGIQEPLQQHRSGFQEFGLPFASDPAITRHLAAFLRTHGLARPDIVLLNGGFFESPLLRQRLLDVLASWFRTAEQPDWQPQLLENQRLDLAVAFGAAHFAMVRRGYGERIAAGLARSYYIGVAGDPPQAVCLAPAGVEAGQEVHLPDRKFQLLVSQPAEFPFYSSSVRLTDAAGDLIEVDREQVTPLPPIRTVLKARRKADAAMLSVTLHARLTEIGVLEMWCEEVEGDRRWRLQFDVRSATQTDVEAHRGAGEQQGTLDESVWADCRHLLHAVFAPEGTAKPQKLHHELAAALEMDRGQWPMSLLRRIWDELLTLAAGRGKSPAHEARWLNLLGYCLRPGYGMAADDWRVAETWKILQGKLTHGSAQCRTESWILWRRIAGGLSAGQQQALADPLLAAARAFVKRATTGRGGSSGEFNLASPETAELWRLLGSLELLPLDAKHELGDWIAELAGRKKMAPVRPAMLWTWGRLGSRVPVYGPLNSVAATEKATQWLDRLLAEPLDDPLAQFAAMQLARRTDDRYRDVAAPLREQVAERLQQAHAPQHLIKLVIEGGALDAAEQATVMGDQLPLGLRIS